MLAHCFICQKCLKGFYTNKLIAFTLPYLSQRAMLGFQYDPKLKKQLENVEKVGVIFMYVSKAFDTINHSLLLQN